MASAEPAATHAPIGVSLRRISLSLERAPLLARTGGGAGDGSSGLRVLRDVTGEFPAGSLSLIIGGSGSGKTSLLNALAMRLGSVGYRLSGALALRGCATAGGFLRPSHALPPREWDSARACVAAVTVADPPPWLRVRGHGPGGTRATRVSSSR
jgi:hypothetical protein